MQATGRDVLVFAPDIAPTQIGTSKIIPMPSIGMKVAPETRIALPNLMINHHLDAFQPDLIHLFSPALLSVSGVLAGRRRQIPVIANYQTDIPTYANHYGFSLFARASQAWLRFIHNKSHLTLVPSSYTLGQLQKAGYKRLKRWGRGVNTSHFNPERRSTVWRERLLNGRNPQSLLAIYVGRLANEKRVDLLLEAAKTPGISLTIIGDGALREDLQALFAGTNTFFTGYFFGDDLAHAYASADVFMFPSPSETFGQVVQEAMASGLPAIVTNQGGVVDLVQDGQTGYICEPNAHAFAQSVRRLYEVPNERIQMAQAARAYAELHPWSAVMTQLEGYYTEAYAINKRVLKRQRFIAVRNAF